MQLQSSLATRDRAAGALIDRQRSAGFFEIRRMNGYGMAACGGAKRTFAKTSRSACVDSGSGSPAGGMTRTENKSDRYSQDLRTARGATVIMVLPMVGFSRRGDQ